MAAQLRVRTSAVRSVATPLSIPFQPRPIENPEQFYPTPLYTASAGYLVGCGHTKLSRACHANSFGGRTGGTLAYTQCIGHSTTFVCNISPPLRKFLVNEPKNFSTLLIIQVDTNVLIQKAIIKNILTRHQRRGFLSP